jgi:hypothetical protein
MPSKRTPPQAWFRNPTEDTAIYKIYRQERNIEKMLKNSPQKVYIASPYRGDTVQNVRNAITYCRFAVEEGKFPIAPHIWLPRFLDDNKTAERAVALNIGIWLLTQCSEVWVFCGNGISDGMKGEIAAAKKHHKPIRYFNNDCREVYPKC